VRHRFAVDGATAWVVEPRQAAPGKPWTWCLEFPDAFTERTGVSSLLEQGFHHVHLEVGNTFGCPRAQEQFDAFYQVLRRGGLGPKAALIGISRGGLYAYRWAARASRTRSLHLRRCTGVRLQELARWQRQGQGQRR
jgi:sialidase-1